MPQKMRCERDLNPFHEQCIGRLAGTMEQVTKRRADVEEHLVRQAVGIGDLHLCGIDVKVGEGALVQQCRREIEMKTFHPVRKLEMALLRSHGYEIAHARSGKALLNFAVAGPANHPAA